MAFRPHTAVLREHLLSDLKETESWVSGEKYRINEEIAELARPAGSNGRLQVIERESYEGALLE